MGWLLSRAIGFLFGLAINSKSTRAASLYEITSGLECYRGWTAVGRWWSNSKILEMSFDKKEQTVWGLTFQRVLNCEMVACQRGGREKFDNNITRLWV